MNQTTIAKWQKQFLEGGREALARGDNAQSLASRREVELAGVAPHVALRLACEDVRPLVDGVDSNASFALYEAPDRLVVHRDDGRD